MNQASSGSVHSPVADLFSLVACVSLGTAGFAVFLGLPVILGAYSDALGFDARQLGWIASIELAGMLIASLATSSLVARGWYRGIAIAGIVLAVTANLVSVTTQSVGVLIAVRALAGVGGGLCYSIAIAALCLGNRPARNFSVLGLALIVVGSLELYALPLIVSPWGADGAFVLLASLYVAPSAMLRAIPTRRTAQQRTGLSTGSSGTKAGSSVTALAICCLVAIMFFNLAAAGFWSYSERIGVSIGMSRHDVASMLTVCNLLSIGGCVLAWWAAPRWGQYRLQLTALLVIIAVFAVWARHLDTAFYVGGTMLYFEAWALSGVLQMGTLSAFDASGRFAALVPAAQGLGQSAGPLVAGTIAGADSNYPHMLAASAAFVTASVLGYAWVYARLKRDHPALADA